MRKARDAARRALGQPTTRIGRWWADLSDESRTKWQGVFFLAGMYAFCLGLAALEGMSVPKTALWIALGFTALMVLGSVWEHYFDNRPLKGLARSVVIALLGIWGVISVLIAAIAFSALLPFGVIPLAWGALMLWLSYDLSKGDS